MTALTVAALFVLEDGPYSCAPDVDVWGPTRDARAYAGPYPVVAHPPCERWGRYWSGGPSAKVRRTLGDDDGCFASALASVRRWGGVLEHPAHTHAWAASWLTPPDRAGGWAKCARGPGASDVDAWVCHVEQGHYSHAARKATWLYAVSADKPADLTWGPAPQGARLDEGFHSKEERAAARAAGRVPIKRLSSRQNAETPIAFHDALIRIVQESHGVVAG